MRNLNNFILEQVGEWGDIRDTAVDEVSFNQRRAGNGVIYNPHGSKPSFTASFPILYEPGWMKELKGLKKRDVTREQEIKWQWFQWVRYGLGRQLLSKVYSGLGEATIFINDLHPFIEDSQRLLLDAGFSKSEINHPFFRGKAIEYAAESILWNTPAWAVHGFEPNFLRSGFVPVDTVVDEFEPGSYLQKISDGKGLVKPQNAQLLAAELQAGFQEVLIPNTWQSVVDHLCETTRYLTDSEVVRNRVILLSLLPKRTFDGGNEKVSSMVGELRKKASDKIKRAFGYEYPELEWEELGATVYGCDSADSYELQMADLAAGYAEELFREKYQGSAQRLREHFKCVFYNGKLIGE